MHLSFPFQSIGKGERVYLIYDWQLQSTRDVNYVSISFVRNADEIKQLKKTLTDHHSDRRVPRRCGQDDEQDHVRDREIV